MEYRQLGRSGLLIWSPLAGGLLPGKYRRDQPAPEGSRHATDWDEPPVYDEDKLWDTVDALIEIAEEHGARVVQGTASVKHLIETRCLRVFHINNGKPFSTVGNISVSAGNVHATGLSQSYGCIRHRDGSIRIRDIEHFHAVVIGDKRVAKLHGDAAWIAQEISG